MEGIGETEKLAMEIGRNFFGEKTSIQMGVLSSSSSGVESRD